MDLHGIQRKYIVQEVFMTFSITFLRSGIIYRSEEKLNQSGQRNHHLWFICLSKAPILHLSISIIVYLGIVIVIVAISMMRRTT